MKIAELYTLVDKMTTEVEMTAVNREKLATVQAVERMRRDAHKTYMDIAFAAMIREAERQAAPLRPQTIALNAKLCADEMILMWDSVQREGLERTIDVKLIAEALQITEADKAILKSAMPPSSKGDTH